MIIIINTNTNNNNDDNNNNNNTIGDSQTDCFLVLLWCFTGAENILDPSECLSFDCS